ncbi:MAG: LexA family protein [Rubricoccaceae bacterium]
MSRRQLTPKQRAFLEYLHTHLRTHQTWPTYRELVEHFDYRSPNSVTQNLQALLRKGFLLRDRSGYQLVGGMADASGRVVVRGVLQQGRVEVPAEAEAVSLASLLGDHTSVFALRLSDETVRRPGWEEAEFILLSDEDTPAGEHVVVLIGATVSLGLVTAAGEVELDGADALPEHAEVLGRYVGHAGPYGVVRARQRPSGRTSLTPEQQLKHAVAQRAVEEAATGAVSARA